MDLCLEAVSCKWNWSIALCGNRDAVGLLRDGSVEFPYKCDKLFPPFFFAEKQANKSCCLTSAWPQSVGAGEVGDKPAVTCIVLLDLVGSQLLCVRVLQ